MKQKTAKLVSSAIHLVAKKSADTVCNWRSYQPKVPMKLRNVK